jgi:predicted nucleic acid-binding Zn ribbon protein
MRSWVNRKLKAHKCIVCSKIFFKFAPVARLCSDECRKPYTLNYHNNRRKQSIKGTLYSVVAGAKSRAKKKNIECDIDYDYIVKLYELQKGLCAKTNVPLEMSNVNTRHNTNPNTVSIDRIDSKRGYVKDNVELVTTIYNTAKNNWSYEDVLAMSHALVKFERS